MKKLFSSPRTGLATACLAILLFASCKKSDSDYVAQPVSGLMAFNLVSDKPQGIGIALSNSAITQVPLAYAGFTGAYLSIFPNSYTVQAYDGGGYATSITSTSNSFAPNKYYSLFVTGANGVYSNVFSEDNFDSLSVANGQAYIRYVNAIPDSSNPRVTITANGSAVSNNTAHYGTVSQFTQVSPGSVSINVSNDGNIQTSRTITLEGKKAYTVLLIGLPGSTEPDKAVQVKFVENGRLE